MNEKQRQRIAEAPESARGILTRAYKGNSRATAVKAFCLQCVGYTRADVKSCTATGCPLWPYRPYRIDDDDEAEENAQES